MEDDGSYIQIQSSAEFGPFENQQDFISLDQGQQESEKLKKVRMEMAGRKYIKRATQRLISRWEQEKVYGGVYEEEAKILVNCLYGIMAELFQYFALKYIAEGKHQQMEEVLVAKVEQILKVIKIREEKMESMSEVILLQSVIDSMRILANELCKQKMAKNQELLNSIFKNYGEKLGKIIISRIVLFQIQIDKDDEIISLNSNSSFNPNENKKVQKKYDRASLKQFLDDDILYKMRKIMQSIKVKQIRYNLLDNFNKVFELKQDQIADSSSLGSQLSKIGKECENMLSFQDSTKKQSLSKQQDNLVVDNIQQNSFGLHNCTVWSAQSFQKQKQIFQVCEDPSQSSNSRKKKHSVLNLNAQ